MELLLLLFLSALPLSLGSLNLCPPASRQTPPEATIGKFVHFLYQHWHEKYTPPDCDDFMNEKLQNLGRTFCKRCNTVILGDGDNFYSDHHTYNDVIKVCNGEGTWFGDNLYQSFRMFRMLICTTTTPRARPPDCRYTAEPYSGRITVACEEGFPVHFEGC